MTPIRLAQLAVLLAPLAQEPTPAASDVASAPVAKRSELGKTFDYVWRRFDRHYPYFDLYGVDWHESRASFRPLALAAKSEPEFAHVMLRMLAPLDDAHVSYVPPLERWAEEGFRWHYPRVGVATLERSLHVVRWPAGEAPMPPPGAEYEARPFPEVVTVDGVRVRRGTSGLLAVGDEGTTVELGLRWANGTETTHELTRTHPLAPPTKDATTKWLVARRVGDVGYLRITTFTPERAEGVETAKEMRVAIDDALDGLMSTRALVVDVQRNGGGYGAVIDMLGGRFTDTTRRYRVRGGVATTRIVRPREPRYEGRVAVLVGSSTASAGEWIALILRDAGAVVIGEPTAGAEAPVMKFTAPDGAEFEFGASRLVQPGVTPFQDVGLELDVAIPMTVDEARRVGVDAMALGVAKARVRAALDALDSDAPVDELVDPELVSGAWSFTGE